MSNDVVDNSSREDFSINYVIIVQSSPASLPLPFCAPYQYERMSAMPPEAVQLTF